MTDRRTAEMTTKSREFRVPGIEQLKFRNQFTPAITSAGHAPLRFRNYWRQDGECRVQSTLRNPRGFTYIGLLVILVIIGISLGAAGKYWQNVIQRDKEEELLFRGDQYKQAIDRYYGAVPGKPQYPRRIEDLLQDSRTPVTKRHLRRQYKDPITGEDFALILGVDPAGKYIMGVHSTSQKTPLKQSNFPDDYQDFAGKEKYSDWQFLAAIQQIPLPPGRFQFAPQAHQ